MEKIERDEDETHSTRSGVLEALKRHATLGINSDDLAVNNRRSRELFYQPGDSRVPRRNIVVASRIEADLITVLHCDCPITVPFDLVLPFAKVRHAEAIGQYVVTELDIRLFEDR